MVNWNPYLKSICEKYKQWWQFYTLTDVEGRQQIETERSPLLLGLMVQTVQPAKEEPNQKQEKIERLGVLEGLRKYAKELLLVGRPGSGKSTALARLLLEAAEECRGAEERQTKIPVLVELRYYQTSVLDLIRSFFKQHGLLLAKAEIEKLLFEQRFLLLVDGLNELPSEAARQDLIVFRRENAATPMIFTTRDLSVGGDLGIAKKLEMQHLTEPQMRDFVKRYLPEQGDRLLRQLGDRLREFGQTPLLLWMLCSVFRATGNVPPNLGLVFRQFTQIYERQLKQDVPVTDESRRWWQLLLEHLALRMTQGRELTQLQVAISRKEAEEILTEFLRKEEFDKPRERAFCWLQDLLNHHLIQLGAEDKIEFRHQLIQEYYTAESLLKQLPQLSNDSLKRDYLNYLKWTEPLALMLELVEQEEQALRVVKLALEVDLSLGARLAGAVKQEFQEKTVGLITKLEVSKHLQIKLLGLTRSNIAISHIEETLEDEYADIRKSAIEVLCKIGNQSTLILLIKALQHEDINVRKIVACKLGEFTDESLITPLVQTLQNKNENSEVRSGVAVTLGKIRNEAVSHILEDILANVNEDCNVRMNAASALKEINPEAAIPHLKKALRDEEFGVGWTASHLLVEIGGSSVEAILYEALKDIDPNVRLNSAHALAAIGGQPASTAIFKALRNEFFKVDNFCFSPHPYKLLSVHVIPGMIQVLGDLADLDALSFLLQLSRHKDTNIRMRAIESLGKIGGKTVFLFLKQILACLDEEPFIRYSAAEALGKTDYKEGVPILIEVLRDEIPIVREGAVAGLERTYSSENSREVIIGLVKALRDKAEIVRQRAAMVLDNIGEYLGLDIGDDCNNIISALIQSLEDTVSSIRFHSAQALWRIGNKNTPIVPLIKALNDDEESTVRMSAARALGVIDNGSEEVCDVLMKALSDTDIGTRTCAAEALGNVGRPELVQVLWKLRLDTVESYIDAAISAIQNRCKFYNYTLTQPPLPLAKSIAIPMSYILHLSDLHFGTPDNAQVWYTQLAADLRRELNCTHLDTLILSGDIANKSTPEEYDAAKLFIDKLITAFQLKSDQIVIVPGNHDLNWGLAQEAYSLMYRDRYQGELKEGSYISISDKVIEVRDEDKYKQRFNSFSKFYQDIKAEPYPLEYEQQGILHHLPEQNLLILGLNSAWQLDHHYKSRASIHSIALSNALEKIDTHYTTYEKCLKIAVWHHPLDSAFADRITDQGFMEQLAVAGFRLFLHGHIHKAETSLYRYDLSTHGRKLDRICAGTFGARVREWVPGYPLQYNLLKFEDNKLAVHTRRREELNGAWKPDARWLMGAGQNPLPYYEIQL